MCYVVFTSISITFGVFFITMHSKIFNKIELNFYLLKKTFKKFEAHGKNANKRVDSPEEKNLLKQFCFASL